MRLKLKSILNLLNKLFIFFYYKKEEPNSTKSWVSYLTAFTCVISVCLNSSKNIAQSKFENLISLGVEQTLQFNYKSAEETFQKAITQNPMHPAGYYQYSQIYLWYFLGSKGEDDFVLFQKYSDLALEKIDKMEKENETAKMFYLRGQIETGRAIGLGATGDMMSAFWASKAAVSAFEDALELNPKMYEAYVGIGVFNYALSFVPGMLQFAIGITGLSSDKTLGMNNLSLGLKSNGPAKYEAAFHLTKIYAEYVADFDSAKIVSDIANKKYPDNELFHYQTGLAYILAGDLNKAERSLSKAIKIDHPKFKMTTSLSLFLKGDIYYRKNEFINAIKYYKKFIKKAVAIDFTGIANYRMAISYLMLGNEHSAKKHLLLANMGNEGIAEDEFASEYGKTLISDWKKPYFKEMLINENNLFASNFKAIIEKFKNTAETGSKLYDTFRLAILAWSYTKTGKHLEAILMAEKSLEVQLEDDHWFQSLAALANAEASFQMGNKNKAREYLELAEDKLVNENRVFVESRINRLKRKLGVLD